MSIGNHFSDRIMKHQSIGIQNNSPPRYVTGRISRFGRATAQAALLGLGAAIAAGQVEDPFIDDQGAQVLTRGPVHEAFAGIVSYNPEPGVIVRQAPPQAIEELPPDIRPAGDNITWIPGYWGWDDERSDYLWISGTWRALPPGRQWTSGYWGETAQGHQWASGYWADSSVREVAYLPRPPRTVEAGPNVAAPSRDHGWTPGNWMWQQERYAWRPGYWAPGRSDWDWIPAHHVWTPRGYVFVDGYWDYSFNRRGVLYAPVYFQQGYHSRPGYSYSPVIAIGLVAMMEHLFLRPNYHHYYFGDYYDRGYRSRGYYSPYAYQSSRYGYDPVYSYRRWTHREDREWEQRYQASYDYRRDHQSARPPRTWADQKRLRPDTSESRRQQLMMAAPLDQMAKQKDSPIRVQPVPARERQQLTEMGREVRKARERRQALEAEGAGIASGDTEREIKPSKATLPASPIVGRSPERFGKQQAPPAPQRSPGIDPADSSSGVEKPRPETKRQTEPRGPETPKNQPPSRRAEEPQTKKQQPAPGRRVENPQDDSRPEPQDKAKGPERRTQPQEKAREPERRTQPQEKAREPERRTQPQEKAREPERRTQPQEKAREPERRTQPQEKAREPERGTQPQQAPRQPSKTTPVTPAEDAKPKGAGNRTPKAANPPAGDRKTDPDREDDGKSSGKSQRRNDNKP